MPPAWRPTALELFPKSGFAMALAASARSVAAPGSLARPVLPLPPPPTVALRFLFSMTPVEAFTTYSSSSSEESLPARIPNAACTFATPDRALTATLLSVAVVAVVAAIPDLFKALLRL